jgi:hypothetical protein
MTLPADATAFAFFETDLPFQSIVLLFLRVKCEVIHPCFIHGYESTQKLPLYCYETSPNIRLKHTPEAVFIPL